MSLKHKTTSLFFFFSEKTYGPNTMTCGILVVPPVIEPTLPAMEGGVFTTAPLGESQACTS